MKKYILKNIQVLQGVVYIELSPGKHSRTLKFEPGQYATIGFRGANGRLSPMRCFSITSSTNSDTLQFAARLSGNFTKALSELSVGDEINVQGPFGEFFIDRKYDRKVVMIAGGIGVTPFMSMIRTAADTKSPLPMTLLYSCRSNEGIPFHDELRSLEEVNPNFRVIIFATDQTNSPEIPRMHSGRMNQQHINQIVGDNYGNSTYFICGPKGFTESTESMLLNKKVDEERIVIESFAQASKTTIGGYNLVKVTYGFAASLLVASIIFISLISGGHHAVADTSVNTNTSSPASQADTSNDSSSSKSVAPSSASTQSSATSTTTQKTNNYQQPVTSVS